jgi:hypothetical protein
MLHVEIASAHRRREESMNNNITSIAIIAIVAAPALLGVVVITIATIPLQQEAEARGCPGGTPAPNASKGRCFGH